MKKNRENIHLLCAAAAAIFLVVGPPTANAQTPAAGPAFADLPVVRPVMECAQLKGMNLSAMAGVAMAISAAEVKRDGPAPYCEVHGYVSPQVDFEMVLPTTNWTQRYVQNGCGGLCGSTGTPRAGGDDNGPSQRGELALATTGAGHVGGDGVWAADDPELRIDFAYRAVHVTSLAAKALIEKYYGQKPKFSYFIGSSEGGREAAMEAQRFPDDFNGISCGSPALQFITQNTFYHAWNAVHNSDDSGHAILTPDKLPILHAAAMAACDAQDGLKDGMIADPRACHFDPSVVQCKPGDDPATCLTAAQVNVAREVYKGAHDDKGEQVIISGPFPGSELSWTQFVPANLDMTRAGGAVLANSLLKYMAFPKNPPLNYKLTDFHFDLATFKAIAPMHAIYDAVDPDLSKFAAAGGKIIMSHGWADSAISPVNTVAYYVAMKSLMGEDRVKQFSRLYMIPGRYHGASGDTGPIALDTLSPVMSWVEKGAAPNSLMTTYQAAPANATGGRGGGRGAGRGAAAPAAPLKVLRTRPVFPYPLVAQYKGSGSIDDAANFQAVMPSAALPEKFNWMGNSFFNPHYEEWCGWTGMSFACGKEPR